MTYVENIIAVYDSATRVQRRDGKSWYPAMRRIMREHAYVTGLTVYQCAAVYAACSINTPWVRNMRLAAIALDDYVNGRVLLTGGTLHVVRNKVRALCLFPDRTPLEIDGILSKDKYNYKLINFYRNLSGRYHCVTIDRWAYRIATGFADCNGRYPDCVIPCKKSGRHGCGKVPKGKLYKTIADAYVEAARQRDVSPSVMQAVTWCVVRGDGK